MSETPEEYQKRHERLEEQRKRQIERQRAKARERREAADEELLDEYLRDVTYDSRQQKETRNIILSRMRKHKKLFVWTDFMAEWTSGIAFALADSEEDARIQIEEAYGHKIAPGEWGSLTIYDTRKKAAHALGGCS